jgi:hypothetical protein
LPSFKERDMHWVPPPGTSHPDAYRITEQRVAFMLHEATEKLQPQPDE